METLSSAGVLDAATRLCIAQPQKLSSGLSWFGEAALEKAANYQSNDVSMEWSLRLQ
jgi:hypothetical protein